jgi:hypothetical protein
VAEERPFPHGILAGMPHPRPGILLAMVPVGIVGAWTHHRLGNVSLISFWAWLWALDRGISAERRSPAAGYTWGVFVAVMVYMAWRYIGPDLEGRARKSCLKRMGRIRNVWVLAGGVGGYRRDDSVRRSPEEIADTRRPSLPVAATWEIREHGLILNTCPERHGVSVNTPPIWWMNSPPDLCLLCVKGYDLQSAVLALSRKVKRMA